MAVVRFSDKLKEEIENNARRIFAGKSAAHYDSLPCTYGDRMYAQAYGKWEATMNELPDHYMDVADQFKISVVFGKVGGEDRKVPFGRTKEFRFSKPRRMPTNPLEASGGRFREGNWRSQMGYVCSMNDPEDAQFFQTVWEWFQQGREITKQAEEFLQGVHKIMNSFTTLAPALKAWPPLWDLLPEWAKERHKEVRKREKRDPTEGLDVDLNKLTGVVVGNKLTGGR